MPCCLICSELEIGKFEIIDDHNEFTQAGLLHSRSACANSRSFYSLMQRVAVGGKALMKQGVTGNLVSRLLVVENVGQLSPSGMWNEPTFLLRQVCTLSLAHKTTVTGHLVSSQAE